jgi:beta-N-acetylhexosaminidase
LIEILFYVPRIQNTDANRNRASQAFIIGFDGTEISPTLRSLLTRLQPAGVILFARNIVSAEQTHKLLKDCQACVTTPLFTCVDMEGGRVDRFRALNGGTPSAADVFASGDRKLFRKHGSVIGSFCRALGFNTDFAPVLDLAFEASRSVMSSRAVSANPRETAVYAGEFLSGLRDAGVLGCGKHFPGLGEGNLDSHHQLPIIAKSLGKLWAEDILPYRILRRQMPFVLISHASYPAVTRDGTPASLSKKLITDVLRKRLGYRGLVVSDDLEMGAVLKTLPIEEAAIAHIRAGGDLCLICRTEDLIVRAYEAVVGEAEKDRRFAAQLDKAAKRVSRLKKKLLASIAWKFPSAPTPSKLDRLNRQLWDLTERLQLKNIVMDQEHA